MCVATGPRWSSSAATPGQGKTALLDGRPPRPATAASTVLRATGVEFERGLAFSGLTAVLRPLLARVDGSTTVQAGALRGRWASPTPRARR